MTAKYPVETSDQEGIVDAVNYLLSGPAGLGQNFAGYSSYAETYLTGNFRIPFTQTAISELYVAPIALSNAQQLDARTLKYTFTTPQATPPFSLGNGLTISGITPTEYNSSDLRNAGTPISQIGVVECTTTYVIVRTRSDITGTLPAYVSGGDVEYSVTDTYNSTDANGRVTVTGGSDRVFISGQLDQTVSYSVATGTQDLNVYVAINRYKGFLNEDPTNPDYLFNLDTTVAEKKYSYTGLTGTGTLDLIETVFASLIDQPVPGFYWYILEVYFETNDADMQITTDLFGLRSLSAQVVKQ